MRQFGVFLPQHVNSGIGLKLNLKKGQSALGVVYPDRFVHEQKTDVLLAGMDKK